ncbi:hypothetical protein ACTACH_04575 [Pseudomonas syringae]|uniref:hypothetical protein n=1 Tax=Pseudomonas syringae TaxID=317 RepID=UPI000AA3B9FD|nr:hypothetical protein [Pseudomonas syringae]
MEDTYILGGSPDWAGTRFELMCMILDRHGLTMKAAGVDEEVTINFKSIALRQRDESDALTIPWREIEGWKQFFIGTVQRSTFLTWFLEEGGGIRLKDDLTHYFIAFNNDVLDVIAYEPPTIVRMPFNLQT